VVANQILYLEEKSTLCHPISAEGALVLHPRENRLKHLSDNKILKESLYLQRFNILVTYYLIMEV
jgi:hypothetical protein